jgi:putative peptidoglycan lipid II flippase
LVKSGGWIYTAPILNGSLFSSTGSLIQFMVKLNLSKNFLVVLAFTVLVHGLTFGREMAIAFQFGVSSYADAMSIGLIPINLYLSVWGTAYVSAALVRIKSIDNQDLISASLQPLVFFGVLSVLVFYYCATLFVDFFSPSLTPGGRELAIALVECSSLGALLVSLTAWGKGLLHFQGRFTRASFSDLMPNSGFLIGIVFLFEPYGVYGVAGAGLVGYTLQCLISVDFGASYFKWVKISATQLGHLKVIFANMGLALLSYSVVYVNLLVDRFFAARLPEGNVAILGFGEKLMVFPLYTVIFAITTVTFPHLIQIRDNKPAFTAKVKQIYAMILVMSLFITAVSLSFSEFLVALVFNYGAFDETAVTRTASVFVYFMFGFTGQAYVYFASRVRFALEDFKVPVIAGLFSAVINIILDILLVDPMGIQGLALATSVSAFVNAAILIFYRRP